MLKVVSLYTGVGGLDAGFHTAPFQVQFCCDIDSNARNTFLANHPSFDDASYHLGSVVEALHLIPLNPDVLLAGFPCPAWSLRGARRGFTDARGQEALNCMEAVLRVRPKLCLFENVTGLLTHDNGESFKVLKNLLEDGGYFVRPIRVRMADYGVPQSRNRVIVVAGRSDVFSDEDLASILFPKVDRDVTCYEAIGQMEAPTKPAQMPNHNLHVGNGESKMWWIRLLAPGENLARLSVEEVNRRQMQTYGECRPVPKSRTDYIRLHPDRISPTMMFGNTSLPIHYREDRNLSVREAAILQGFPLDFVFTGGIAAQYKQVGNAVPPLFSRLLAKTLQTLFAPQSCLNSP